MISKTEYKKDRYARRGTQNPEWVVSSCWSWLAADRRGPYGVGVDFELKTFSQPRWTFDRFGQSETELPDGRRVWIAGEHEDYYDPDFYIYNDVVIETDGEFEFLLYTEDCFPPTDFHSATLIGDQIFIIGSVGYSGRRRFGETQVYVLDTGTWEIEKVAQSGPCPGWIHNHNAVLNGIKIEVTGGTREVATGMSENFDKYLFDPSTGAWEKLTHNRYTQFEVRVSDGKTNHLWELRQAIWTKEMGWGDYEKEIAKLKESIEMIDLDKVRSLYQPSFPHKEIESSEGEDEYNVYRFEVDGVVVRHVEDMWSIRVVIEGDLDPEVVRTWRQELSDRLAAIEGRTCETVDLA